MMWHASSKPKPSRSRSHDLPQAGTAPMNGWPYAAPIEPCPHMPPPMATAMSMPAPFHPIGAPVPSAVPAHSHYQPNSSQQYEHQYPPNTQPGFHVPSSRPPAPPGTAYLPSFTSTTSSSSYDPPSYQQQHSYTSQHNHTRTTNRSPSPYRGKMPSPVMHAQIPPPGPSPTPSPGPDDRRTRSRSPAGNGAYVYQSSHTRIRVHSTSKVSSRIDHRTSGRPQSHSPSRPNQVVSSSYNRIPAPAPIIRPSASSQALPTTKDTHGHGRPAKLTKPPKASRPAHGHTNSAPQNLPQVVHYTDGTHGHLHQQGPEFDKGFQYSTCTGRKRALCIGINYANTPNALLGCVNDANNVRRFLIKYHGFSSQDIVLLTDEARDPRSRPTRENMINAMKWLVRDACPNDSLFFHYSGHGAQIKDKDGDEPDGFDELIFPSDFKKRGHILDDEMHAIMVRPLPVGCRLTALFDSCHSGTALDLPYMYHADGRFKRLAVSAQAHRDRTRHSKADVISFSGCKDSETSADTTEGGLSVGAMSYAFMTALKTNPDQTFAGLLRSIRRILRDKYEQRPQLSSSHRIDTSLKFII